MPMGKQETEAYDLVSQLNEELYGRFGDEGINDVPSFTFSGNEFACAILWGDICVWDSENCSGYDDDDNEIPIESYVREALDQIATGAEWIARGHAREKVSLDHCLFYLNGLVKVDAEAMALLVEARVACNEAMADHPTVQVQSRDGDNKDVVNLSTTKWTVGFLGILNGLFGAFRDGGPKDGWGQIAAVFEDDGKLSGFRRTQDPGIVPCERCVSCGGRGFVCATCAGNDAECRELGTCKFVPKDCAVCEGTGYLKVKSPNALEVLAQCDAVAEGVVAGSGVEPSEEA